LEEKRDKSSVGVGFEKEIDDKKKTRTNMG
jgi:hypothetical protein